ncbi:heme ABC transporter ATP-binding protein [Ruegeria sp. Ofav3-42]|uniref:heme ABC transporter ATP-binding protein n=1 Tax=Ruegeria sp. Ofav3-42 TaxID=2917759 RepID=UPI001EF674BD|nr:heme ABC transporter ATP-binding protein [Ruegeria sp. Ofav3-42]MCG7519034.1 heme ABC transporter ATP-binding protein [Ruegeria sp. Ofav3-42]
MKGENIRVSLGRKEILHGVDFDAEPGKVTAIIGPNGSGKSTLLKALSGEIESSGKVALNGRDISELKPWQLAAMRGVLPQSSTVAFPFSVLEIVRLGLANGLAAGDDTLPSKALAHVDLAGFEHRSYQNLSGGEQQRVQLARVLTQVWAAKYHDKPKWLLLDEPVASLDIAHQFTVLGVARNFAAQGGGVVVVMHDLNLTALFADYVYVLSEGNVWGSGTPTAILNDKTMEQVYGIDLPINTLPKGQVPFILPQAMKHDLTV